MKVAHEIVKLIQESPKIVITSHKSPDGDSIGSSLGMFRFIRALGKDALICHPDPCPHYIDWMKGADVIHDFENESEFVTEAMNTADLIFCLDYNGANRMGTEMGEILLNAPGKKVMIDHHPHPEEIFDISASHPEVCSTSQLILEVIDKSGNAGLLTAEMGTPLYLGIVTDTGSFRFSSVTSRTHELIALLLDAGVPHSEIHEKTFDNNRLDQMKLRGYAIAEKLEVLPEFRLAIVSLTDQELSRFNYIKGDTEGLVNLALSIEGVDIAVLLVEKDAKIKMSFRSHGDIVVNAFARDNFEGGGHMNAAGGISHLSMNETIAKLKALVPTYFKAEHV